MHKVTVYIPAMKLKLIDDYCKEKKIARSRLLVRGAMAIVNKTPKKKCKMCSRNSIGKFRVDYYDLEVGEVSEDAYLCQYHLDKAKREQEVEEL